MSAAPRPASWSRCRDCRATFAEPSFSEGPKTADSSGAETVRFALAWYQCPECLSRNIEPLS